MKLTRNNLLLTWSIFSFFCLPLSLKSQCGCDYKGTYEGHAYFYCTDIVSWGAADAAATAMGGYLTAISSAGENSFVASTVLGGNLAWIGLNDVAVEGTFVWSNGEPVVYTNWGAGEPNNAGNEDWTEINRNGLGKWNDLPAGFPRRYVVEFDSGDNDNDGTPDVCDADDDNDGCLDENDANPLVASGDSDCDGVADDCDRCPGGDDSGPCDADAFPGFDAIPESWVCGNNGNKVLLCHNGNTICISPNAVQGHLSNHEDDFLGPCASCEGERDAKPTVEQQLSVEVFPNPAFQEVYVQLKGLANSGATMTISDKLGRVIVTRQLDAQTQDLITVRLNDFATGEYFVRVTTDKEAVTKILTVMK